MYQPNHEVVFAWIDALYKFNVYFIFLVFFLEVLYKLIRERPSPVPIVPVL